MKNSISIGFLTGILSVVGISILAHGLYTGRLRQAWSSTPDPTMLSNPNVSACWDNDEAAEKPAQLTSIKFNTEIVRFLVFNDRLHLLMPLPITGDSATIVDIRDAMKRVGK